jgi:hypothetical protein
MISIWEGTKETPYYIGETMAKRLTTTQLLVLLELLKASNYVYIFTISERLRLDVYSTKDALAELLQQNLVVVDKKNEFKIKITKDGSKWFMRNYPYYVTKEKSWRKPPEEFIQQQIEPTSFYLPYVNKLDRQFLKKYGIKGGSKAGG